MTAIDSRGSGLLHLMQQRPTNHCTIKQIFRGGYIPSLAQTLIFMERDGLNVRAIDNLSYDDHHTVEHWLRNLEAHRDRIRSNCCRVTFVRVHFSPASAAR